MNCRIPYPSLSPGICSNSCPLSWWCHPTISFSVTPFSSCPQSFSVSGSFPMSQVFASRGQSIGASASASILPVNIQGWFPLRLTGLISLQSKVTLLYCSTVFQGTVPLSVTVLCNMIFCSDVNLCSPVWLPLNACGYWVLEMWLTERRTWIFNYV